MKKLFIGILGLVLCVGSVSAQNTYATNNLPATNNTIFATGKILQQIVLWSTNTSPTLVYLRDGELTSTNAAYTNFTYTTSSQVISAIGAAGLTNLYTNTVISYTANNVAASSTNPVVPRYTFVVPASPTIFTYDFDPDPTFANKLTLSNSVAGMNVVLQYRNP